MSEAADLSTIVRAVRDDPERFLDAVRSLETIGTGEAAGALEELEGLAPDKARRREARRALYRLRQRGVATPARPKTTRAGIGPLLGGARPEGFLSFPDPTGSRLVWLLRDRPDGRLHQLVAVVNEPDGLREVSLAEMTRKGSRHLRRELEERHGLRLFEIDWRYADWIVAEGYERATSAGTLPREATHYPTSRLQILARPAEPTATPKPEGLDPEETPDAAGARELLEEPELLGWRLPERTIAPWIREIREARESPIVVDERHTAEKVEGIVARAIREIAEGGTSTWQRLLAEMAFCFAKTGRADAARRCLAAAASLAGGAVSAPFLEELVRRSFALAFAVEEERSREERSSSLLVTPDQLRKRR